MTARKVLDGIKARTEAVSVDGLLPWRRVQSTDGTGTGVLNSSGSVIGYATGTDAAELLAHAPKDLTRLTAAVEAVLLLASKWEARGEHDMAYSKTVQDEHIADFLLTAGATKVENARHIRNAVEGALKEGQ